MADIDVPVEDEAYDMEDDEEEVVFTPETLEAIEEAERLAHDPNAKTYNSFDEILQEIIDEIAEEDRARASAESSRDFTV